MLLKTMLDGCLIIMISFWFMQRINLDGDRIHCRELPKWIRDTKIRTMILAEFGNRQIYRREDLDFNSRFNLPPEKFSILQRDVNGLSKNQDSMNCSKIIEFGLEKLEIELPHWNHFYRKSNRDQLQKQSGLAKKSVIIKRRNRKSSDSISMKYLQLQNRRDLSNESCNSRRIEIQLC